MQRAADLTTDVPTKAEIYSELALETTGRPGMWSRSPDDGQVSGWIERALELGEPGSVAQVSAIVARARRDPAHAADDVREAARLVEHVGDLRLRLHAFCASIDMLEETGRYDEALRVARERLDAVDEIIDPDMREGIYWRAASASLGSGLIDEARDHAWLLNEHNSRLTPHHAVHGVAVRLNVEELAGGWEEARVLQQEAERRVAANVATPCAMAPRSLLVCAVANAEVGDDAEARRLEEASDALGIEGYGLTQDAPRVRLALVRGDLETVEHLLAPPVKTMPYVRLASLAARLDGLVALRDRVRLEEEAPSLLRPDTYLEPFALRALGVTREEAGLVEQALARFEALGLNWHADQTRALL
jgi:hypothetical protein